MRGAAEPDRLHAVAEALWRAERDRVAIPPLTAGGPGLSVADAYQVQLINVRRRQAAGARLCGRKVGLTSRAMQELMGVAEPDFGALLDDMFVEEGEPIPVAELVQPRAEAEIALVLGADLHGQPGFFCQFQLQTIVFFLGSGLIVKAYFANAYHTFFINK